MSFTGPSGADRMADMEQKIYLRALALIGGVLLAASVFISPLYAAPALIATGLVIYSDTRESVQVRVAWSVVSAVGMAAVIVSAGLYGYLWPIPGAALLMATAVWAMLRRPSR